MLIETGVAMAIPDGYVGLMYLRSSLSRRGLSLANNVGVIDSGYRGEILVNISATGPASIRAGERIAQLVVVAVKQWQFYEVDILPTSDRGEGGHGSSGV